MAHTDAKPFLKWAGGKTALLRRLLAATPDHIETYYEPFLGGGALFFALQNDRRMDKALLFDGNADLISAFVVVRDHRPSLLRRLRTLEAAYLSAADRAKAYYDVRAANPRSAVGRAARLLFLNKTCFNGLYRVNGSGNFNVPHGRYKNPTICNPKTLTAASAALQGVNIAVADFADACDEAGDGDFVYFDPPYEPVSLTASFTSYTRDRFSWEDQRRLAGFARQLADRGAQVLISNANVPRVAELYRDEGFQLLTVKAPRVINSRATRRGSVTEILAANYNIHDVIQGESSSPKKNRSHVSRSSKSTALPVEIR